MNQYSYIDFKFEQGKCQPLCIVLSASELQAELACSRKQLLKGDVVPTGFLSLLSVLEMLFISTSAW